MSKRTQKLIEALRQNYLYPERGFIEEFRGGTGWSRESRADAIAMDLWPSKGLELIGFEIKTSRQDWLKELKTPDKCVPIKQFCDRWYLVIDDMKIINYFNTEELPDDWGLMCMNYLGKVEIKKEAPKLKAEPIDRAFLAALIRRASKPVEEVIINGRKYSPIPSPQQGE